jgi:phage tail sheath protein FI
LTGFAAIDGISIVYAPNPQVVPGLAGALITHCETLKDRFTIIDASQSSATITDIDPRSTTMEPNAAGDTKYAAFYYPWIKVIDPEAGLQRKVPPGGHVAGIYARSDTERGVHKAPANETVRGVVDLEFQITKGEHDILNPRGVNVIRAFPGRGIRVWGARTLSSNTLWKYINVRRLFIFLEGSIEEGTQWVVFEPNAPRLWARVRAGLTEFLTRVWKDGALFGNTAEEAFFVKCDETTMTQADIDNGRLICIIGVAPVKPAEFVIFRIAQWRGGSSVTE